jgi:hypothetical protein
MLTSSQKLPLLLQHNHLYRWFYIYLFHCSFTLLFNNYYFSIHNVHALLGVLHLASLQ